MTGWTPTEQTGSVQVPNGAATLERPAPGHGGTSSMPIPQDTCTRISRITALAENLLPGEALAIPGIQTWIARTKSGALRIGFGWLGVYWSRGEWRDELTTHVTAQCDSRQVGYFADRNRREIDVWLGRPLAHRLISRIGVTTVQVERDGRPLTCQAADRSVRV